MADNSYMTRHQKRAGRMCALLIESGFNSAFEHVQPIMNSQRVWTLWINMTSGEDVLTMVDHLGRIAFYRLTEVKSLDKPTTLDLSQQLATTQAQADSFARLLALSSSVRPTFTDYSWCEAKTEAAETAVTYLITRGLAVRHSEQAAWWRFVEVDK